MDSKVKISGKSGRPLAVLAGAALLAAGALASGGPAVAAATGTAHPVSRGMAHPVPRAAALDRLLHRGVNIAEAPRRGSRAPARPRGSRSVPEPGNSSQLQGVFCTSPSNCWAVGNYSPATDVVLNEVLHWNGTAWAQVTVPSPAGSTAGDFSDLISVRCLTASDCWAVGAYEPNAEAEFNQALHWNGRTWSVVPAPAPGGSIGGDTNELFEVVCTSSANCWAVGFYQLSGGAQFNEALHWNGRAWALASVPNPGGSAGGDVNKLNSVRCTSAGNCLAVGTSGTQATLLNEGLRWNGTTWSQVTAPNPGGTTGDGTFNELQGLGCSSSTNCWAVGSYGTFAPPGTSRNQALHWNGTAWTQVFIPDPNGTGTGAQQQLAFATCKSATDCWAVGSYGSPLSPGFVQNQAMHWDGGLWSQTDTPEPGGTASGDVNNLNAARCISPSNCWAVGTAQSGGGSSLGQALHWNGTTWSTG
jgi:hypothetical protein